LTKSIKYYTNHTMTAAAVLHHLFNSPFDMSIEFGPEFEFDSGTGTTADRIPDIPQDRRQVSSFTTYISPISPAVVSTALPTRVEPETKTATAATETKTGTGTRPSTRPFASVPSGPIKSNGKVVFASYSAFGKAVLEIDNHHHSIRRIKKHRAIQAQQLAQHIIAWPNDMDHVHTSSHGIFDISSGPDIVFKTSAHMDAKSIAAWKRTRPLDYTCKRGLTGRARELHITRHSPIMATRSLCPAACPPPSAEAPIAIRPVGDGPRRYFLYRIIGQLKYFDHTIAQLSQPITAYDGTTTTISPDYAAGKLAHPPTKSRIARLARVYINSVLDYTPFPTEVAHHLTGFIIG
jgi:hypothetical protein